MQPVKVETDENLQDLVEVAESNGVLYVSPVDNYNLDPTKKIEGVCFRTCFQRFWCIRRQRDL